MDRVTPDKLRRPAIYMRMGCSDLERAIQENRDFFGTNTLESPAPGFLAKKYINMEVAFRDFSEILEDYASMLDAAAQDLEAPGLEPMKINWH